MRVCLVLASLALAGACDPVTDPPEQHLPPAEKPELTLYVSNQSFDIDPVDIEIFIDDRLAVTGDFLVEGQHSWHSFGFDLEPGEHQLRAVSSQAPDQIGTVVIDGEKHVVVNFWFYPAGSPEPYGPLLSLDIYDQPPQFQ